jgi:hypothetical protein
MKTNIKTLSFVGVTTLMLCFVACKKSTPPTVKIYDNAISVSYTSANVTGEVTDEGSSPVTDRGFVYGKQGEARQDTMYCGNGAGEFPTRLTNLEPNTTYNCMAFARNDAGTTYSGKATFTTLPMAQSEVTTYEPTNVTHTHATCGGNVISDGGSEVTERGVCWATTPNPTTSGSHLASGTGTGDFSVNLSGLTANTTYHVRAYAVNEKGTAYGDDLTFRTVAYSIPSVVTGEVTNITSTSATCSGEVTSSGGLTVTARGICWSRTHQNPTISDTHTTEGTGTGEFTSNITGLTQSATYYVCAYATNSQGTGYGETRQFTAAELAYLISQGGTVSTTSGKFYDSGGANGNYSNYENYVMTFNSGTSRKIRMTFTRFETENGYDYLKIYDGPTTSSTLIGTYQGFNSPGTVTATNSSGALTFVWYSDSSNTEAGWEATISTVP